MWVPLRTNPGTIVVVEDDELFPQVDLVGLPPGQPVLFWQWDKRQQQLASFSVAWVITMDNWIIECPVREEVEIPAGLMALPATRSVQGADNDDDDLPGLVGLQDGDEPTSDRPAEVAGNDDDLPGLVGRWDGDEPKSEDQINDEAREGTSDDDTSPAVGEDTD
jgi:hypothetical protein